jgi:hypothetical protein
MIRLRIVAAALTVAATALLGASSAAPAPATVHGTPRATWYTPEQVHAMIGLADRYVPQAGPWYTAAERRALIAYANASFARKRALLNR